MTASRASGGVARWLGVIVGMATAAAALPSTADGTDQQQH